MSAVWTPEWCGLGTAFSIQDVLLYKRLPPDLRGLQEDAVLAGKARPGSEPAHRTVGSSPTSRRNRAAAVPRRIITPDLRFILWRRIKVER